MTDREERQHVIEVLKNMLDWMEAANLISSKPERIEAVKYAIASIETDLKYDLLYEETSEQADKPITKNCESCRYYGSHHKVCNYCYKCSLWTEQEPTTKNNLGVDCISRKAVLDAIDSKAWEFCDYLISKGRNDEQKPVSHFADNLRECVREEIPSVTPQEPILDRVRAEIETKYGQCDICEYDAISGWEQVSDIADILQIIDKYKAESEVEDGNDD